MWKYKLALSPYETLRFEHRERSGSGHAIQRYTVLGPHGEVTGTVQLTEMALPTSRDQCQRHLLQRNAWDDTLVDVSWIASL